MCSIHTEAVEITIVLSIINEALQFVMNQREITARDLADETQVEISLASTKLLNLSKARLVQRSSERLPDGGRQFIYRSLLVER